MTCALGRCNVPTPLLPLLPLPLHPPLPLRLLHLLHLPHPLLLPHPLPAQWTIFPSDNFLRPFGNSAV